MAAVIPSAKRALIDKANTRIVVYVSVAAFILVFSLVAAKTLISQGAYQNRVIGAKRVAVNQLKSDITATAQIKTSYNAFVTTPQNVLGGDPNATGGQNGNNAKIVLDALPSAYDFPGLDASLENLLTNVPGITINSISGTDAEATLGNQQTSSTPEPVAIPFTVSVTGNYASMQSVISAFEHSIRPMQVQTLVMNGNSNNLTMTITAQTYYQPAKTLNINEKVVK